VLDDVDEEDPIGLDPEDQPITVIDPRFEEVLVRPTGLTRSPEGVSRLISAMQVSSHLF